MALIMTLSAQSVFAADGDKPCENMQRMEKLRCLRSTRQGNSTENRNDVQARSIVEQCREERGTLRAQCLKEGRSVKSYKADNREVIKERRLLQRGDRPAKAKKGSESMRRMKKDELKERRMATREEGNARIAQKKTRMQGLKEKQQTELRERMNTVPTRNVLTKSEARTSARRQHERTQERRSGIRAAHDACKDTRGTDRLQCLKDNRAN